MGQASETKANIAKKKIARFLSYSSILITKPKYKPTVLSGYKKTLLLKHQKWY